MRIQPSFWVKMQRLCKEHIGSHCSLGMHIHELFDRIPQASRAHQHALMAELVTLLGTVPNAVALGFAIGEQVQVTAYGSVALGLLTAPTVNDAVRFIADVNQLALPLIDYSYEEEPAYGCLTIGFQSALDTAGEAFAVAMCTASLAKMISRCNGRVFNFTQVDLTTSSKGAEAQYRNLLSAVPYTDAPQNRVFIERAVLASPNTNADEDTFYSVVHACEEYSRLQSCEVALVDRVRESIMSSISSPPSQEVLAKALGLSPRQLRAHLSRVSTSYQAVIRDCRIEYASTLLRNPSLSLSHIAERLGYSDLSSFSHAFCRWTGNSPSAFRGYISARGSSTRVSAGRLPPGTLHYANTGP